MIRLLQNGNYQLIETHRHNKILILDDKESLVWIHAGNIGEILVASHTPHHTDHILASGKYRLYEVKEESKFVDLTHLELLVGNGIWQGYLLPTGLPSRSNNRNRIIPTREVITQTVY